MMIPQSPSVRTSGESCRVFCFRACSESMFSRHLTHIGPVCKDEDPQRMEKLFSHFPSLTSIALEELDGRIPWAVLKVCLALPHVVSVSVHLGLFALPTNPFPQEDVSATPISLKKFSYGITMWREQVYGVDYTPGYPSLRDMRVIYDFERECLSSIVSKLNNSVTSLTLPIESAPLLSMAELSWPHLRELALHGRLLDSEHATSLQRLLLSLSSLRKLSILAGRFTARVRHPLLPGSSTPQPSSLQRTKSMSTLEPSGSSASIRCPATSPTPDTTDPPILSQREPSPIPFLTELRSLMIAYPDPEDGIFSLNLPNHGLIFVGIWDNSPGLLSSHDSCFEAFIVALSFSPSISIHS